MRIIFCDDVPEITAQLRRYINEYFAHVGLPAPECAGYSSGDELLANETAADIAFLDVEMPGLSGINVGAKLKERNPWIKIFIVTSYPDYLDEAMKFQVFRYLSKPIDKNRLFRNLKEALFQLGMETTDVAVKTHDGITMFKSDEIICIETVNRKTVVHTTKGDFYSVDSIEEFRQRLALPCFYSSYRSFYINMKYVRDVKRDRILLAHKDISLSAHLAYRKYNDFRDKYLFYLESAK